MGLPRRTIILLFSFLEFFGSKLSVSAQGCSVGEGGPISTLINDIHEGIIFDLQTTGITGIEQHTYGLNIINPPYVDLEFENSRFVMKTNERFSLYEENEIERSIVIIVRFRCSSNNHLDVTTTIHLHDTNNHAPRFIPTDHYHYVLDAPVPPGYQVTGCLSELIARDVDLTTERIIFDIEQNPFFGITYSAELSYNRSKEFIAIVTTKTFIRNLPEEMTLTITATDVHGTQGEGSHTTSGKITIKGNTNFVLPNEPVFFKTIYNGIYTAADQVELEEFISLQNGYDDLVRFAVEETYKINFRLVKLPDQVNQIMIEVLVPLEEDILLQGSIAIEIIAEREFTSGASATVILQLPQVDPVQFESAHYYGKIENNNLRLSPLLLSQGYEDSVVTASFVQSEYSAFFSAVVQDNIVTVSMTELDQTAIDQNSFINLQIVATARSSTATAVVTLEIIKDDNITPVFEKPFYTGTYDLNTPTGLAVQPIVFTQGYDGVESVVLRGDHEVFFRATQEGPVVTVHVSTIPVELFDLGRIVLSLEATKPRTVGAKATLIVTLPTVVPVQFESAHYYGKIENNNLRLSPLLLSQGYEDSVVTASFVQSEYSAFFSAVVQDNIVTVSMTELDQTAIDQNSFINLQIVATARSSTATAVVTLEIIKDDNITPVFEKPFYTGTYDPNTPTGLAVQPIVFTQGYDGVESVVLRGDHEVFFRATQEGPVVTVHVSTIPAELFDLGRIVLSLEATKSRTVGAKATLIVTLPTVVPVQFESAHYYGKIENNNLRLSPLLLSQGYEDSVVTASFVQSEYSAFFSAVVQDNIVIVSMTELDQTAIDQNSFINLQIVATARSSTATAVITLEIMKDDNITPVFEKPFYTGTYDPNTPTRLAVQPIVFTQGYDGVESVVLRGDHEVFFRATQEGPVVTVHVSTIPAELFDLGRIVLSLEATKSRTVGAKATLIVTLPTVVPVQFESAHYYGKIENNNLRLLPLLLSQGYEDSVVTASFVQSEYSAFFSAVVQDNIVTVSMTELDQTAIDQNSFINLQIVATARSSTATAVITLEIIKDDNITPVFEKPFYTGTYDPNTPTGLAVQPIVFTQGYDGVESVVLRGDHEVFFRATQEGPVVTVHVSTIPAELFDLGRIVLSLEATKSRTVGAKATLIVTLPTVVPVQFESAHYDGKIENNNLRLSPLLLSQGYEDSVVTASFVQSEYSAFFSAVVQDNIVTVSMTELDQTAIDQNSFINLQIVATARSSTATAVITLEIMKDDNITPVFEKPFYTGTYDPNTPTGLAVQPIVFTQGYDGVESVVLRGDHEVFFRATQEGPVVTVHVSTIPAELFDLGRIVLSLEATKSRTVGAKATLIVTLPTVVPVQFESAHYYGKIENNNFRLSPLLLSQGYEDSVVTASFVQSEYSAFFSAVVQDNIVTVSMTELDQTTIDQNSFINLQIVATARSSTATAVITLEIIKDDNITPVFEKPFYTGTYDPNTPTGLAVQPIVFTQGYDGVESVVLRGDHEVFFRATQEGPVVTVHVSTIPAELFDLGRIVLSLEATKSRTVGAKATLIVTLPTVVPVQFESAHYDGKIENNNLRLSPLLLSQGYEDSVVTASFVQSEYSAFFSAVVQDNIVTVSMTELDQTAIDQNSFINLQIVATARSSTATAVITLEIMKDDNITPVFEKPFYTGTYDPNTPTRLAVQPIVFTQGYDGVESVVLRGDHEVFFRATQEGPVVTVHVSTIPAELFDLGRIVLSLEATKSRTVGAKATLIVTLPTVVPVQFESAHYYGKIENNNFRLSPLLLSQGYEDSVVTASFVQSEYSAFFSAVVQDNIVTVSMTELDQTTIDQNSFINLQIVATARSSTATAVITLEIIKDDNITPVFEKPFYTGTYDPNTPTGLAVQPIVFTQGYDGVESVVLRGDHEVFFRATQEGPVVTVHVSTIPAELFDLGRIVLSLEATKPRTVGAKATLIVTLPTVVPVQFESAHYDGKIENNNLRLSPLLLSQGYEDSVVTASFVQSEYSAFFSAVVQDNIVTVSMTELDQTAIDQNSFINLQIVATARSSTATAVITLEIIKDDNITPVFEKPFYTGTYDPDRKLIIEQILFSQGYDGVDTVAFDGEHKRFFTATRNGAHVTIEVSTIPPELFNLGHIILPLQATKPRTVGATTAVIITLPAGSEPEDNVSFQNLVHRGTVQDNVVQHEDIRILGFDGTTVDLHGEYSDLFAARVSNGLVSVTLKPAQNLPAAVTRVALELHARSARAVLLLNVLGSGSEPEDNVSFQNLVHRGTVQDNVVQHEDIRILGFDGTTVDLHGEYSDLFAARVSNGLVSVTLKPAQNLPAAVTRVALELHARSARAVLLLNVLGSGSEPEDNVSFQNLVHRGTVQDNVVQHEDIRILGFDGTTVDLHGEYSDLFAARVTNGLVSVTLKPAQNLPAAVTRVALELHARSARAVLLLNVLGSGSEPEDNVSFQNLVHRGTVQDNVVQHEDIRILGFDGTTVDLHGEYSDLFAARVTNGLVSVTLKPAQNLPAAVTRVALELHARSARAVLLLNVLGSGSEPEDNVSFQNLVHRGSVQDNVVQHEDIRILGFDGTTVDLHGEYSDLFVARVTNGLVSVTLKPAQNLPAAVTRVALELHARSARAVLLLNVLGSGSEPEDNVSFQNLVHRGTVQDNVVQHEDIRILGFDGTTVDLHGEYSDLFAARVTNGLVSVTLKPAQNLPAAVTRVALELHTRSARAVLLLNVLGSGSEPEDNVSFQNLVHRGTVQDNVVQHEDIRILGFDGTTVDLHGEYSDLFAARVTNGLVSVTLKPAQNLPAAVTRVALELHARSARAVLLLNVLGSGSEPEDNVSFQNLVHRGSVQDNVVQHEDIRILGFDGTTVDLHGEYSDLFAARVTNGLVSVTLKPAQNLSAAVTRVALELHARSARAVLLLNVLGSGSEPEDNVSFQNLVHRGSVQDNVVQHEDIRILGFDGTTVDLHGEYSDLFAARVTNGLVSVTLKPAQNLSAAVTRVALELHARSARAVLLLNVLGSGSEPEDNVSFQNLVHRGSVQDNVVQHEDIRILGFDGTTVDLHGEYSDLFAARVTNGLVSVTLKPAQNLPAAVTRVALELHARSARAVLLLNVLGSGSEPEDNVSFQNLVHRGTVQDNVVQHEDIRILGFDGTTVDLHGEYSDLFAARVTNGLVSVTLKPAQNLPAAVTRVALELHARSARAVLLLNVLGSGSEPEDNVSFQNLVHRGTVQDNVVQHEDIRILGFDGTTVDLHGEYSDLFAARVTNGLVSVTLKPAQNLPAAVTRVALELHARSARAVLLLNVLGSGSEPEDNVSFQNLVHRGTVQDNVVQHEDIRILGFDGTTVDLHGEYSDLFAARVTNGLVSVTLKPAQNLPAAVTRVALELHARSARAVLLLNVLGSGSEPEDNVSFQNLVHRGTVQDNVVQHEDIRILGFDGTTVDLHGEYSDLFAARVMNGLVSVTLKPAQNLPAAVTRVALELHARSARAVLLLNVLGSGSEPEDNVSFQNLVHRGTVQDNVVQHEDIRILGFDGTTVDLHGEYSDLFAARVTNGLVSVTLKPAQNLPAAVTRVALELHARSARAVLLLNVLGSGSEPEDNVSFQNLVHRGTVQDNVVQHEDIRILGFDGTTVDLHGEYSDLFAARVTNGLVSVTLKPAQNLPAAVTRVALELHARSARAVLLLNVLGSGSEPEDNVSFQNLVHRGSVQDNVVQHEDIRILGFDGTTVDLHGEYSDLFAARVTNGLVSVTLKPAQNLPAAVTRVALELHARSARAVLLLNVLGSGSEPEDNVSFQNLVHRGTVQDNVVQHEDIRILGFDGTTVDLHGEYSDLFAARVTNGLVSVTLKPAQNLPAAVTRVALELHARSARAVLLLNVLGSGSEPEDNVSFQNLVHRGSVQDNVVQHEDIRILGFDGTTVDLHGEYSDLFAARVTNGLVSVTLKPAQNLPAAVTRVALELHARSARAVLLLNVLGSGSEPEDNVSFQNLVHRGSVQDNVVQHEDIRILGFDGTTVDLHGEYSDLFAARVTNGLVSVTLKPAQNLPAAVTRVALELHARSARAVLLLNVLGSGSEPEDNVSFQNLVHRGTVQDNVVQHEDIRILGFDGTTVDLHGEYSDLFAARVTNGLVSVTLKPAQNLPAAVTRVALELHARSARAVLLLNVLGSGSEPEDNVSFQNLVHRGSVQDNVVQHEDIRILGFDGTTVDLHGEYSDLFAARVTNGLVSVTLKPAQNLPAAVTRVALELHARSARAVLLLNVLGSGSEPEDNVSFQNLVHRGTVQDNVVQHEDIRILGFDGTTVDLHGEYSDLFAARVTNGLVSVTLKPAQNLPAAVTRVALELHARSARAVLLLNVLGSGSEPEDNVSFQNLVHRGTVQDNVVQHEDIRILGFDGTTVDLHGEYSDLFAARVTNGLVSVTLKPAQNLPAAVTRVALELHARSARAVLLLNVLGSGSEPEDNVSFQNLVHRGTVQDNVVQHEDIRILGFDGTTVDLHGEYSDLFAARVTNGLVSVTLKPAQNLPAAVTRVALELHARSARAVLLLNVLGSGSEPEDNVSFQNLVHRGSVQDNVVQHEDIRILGFDGTTVDLHGEYSDLFAARVTNGLVSVTLKPAQNLPAAVTRVALELHARSARAVLLLNVLGSGSEPEDNISFQNLVHRGTVQDNVVQHEDIRILGFDGTTVDLHGEYSDLFAARVTNGLVSVTLKPAQNLPAAVTRVALELHARSARAVLLLNVLGSGSEPEDNVSFQNLVHRGSVQDNVVQHEDIRILGFDGTTVDLHGEYSDLFAARVTNGLVSVTLKPAQNLPAAVTRVALELHARSARAVLLLNVLGSGIEPSVEFSPESYAMLVSTTQTGIVGRVSATSNNNETITYSIDTDNGHLLSRLSINNEGELHLSAPVDSGVYTFQVVAATAQARATATVHLTSQAATVCDDRGIVVPPLIVIDRDEEEEHRNLVVLDPTQHAGCRYTMTNRWPTQQSWLYVDETGLHTTAIDREHESIAFMSVSQVQVELLLQCDNDPVLTRRSKRSYDWLDPYEYGSNKWILTDSIPYNSRRTLVNLIVNDINDNAPIFVGKESEPIAVGYPSSELEERILPRSLAELQATDADIGINAVLRYSSSEGVLAVAPTTGFVHVRSGANLQHNQILTVTATDQNGEGLSGTIQLVVKLLDVSHIAVVTVRDVFLDDEKTVLTQLSDAVGYEVKALRSVVVSDDINEDVTRHKRQTNARTSLQLYVYGLVEQEPVVVTQLTSDLNNQAVIQNIVTIPLETHLENGNTVIQTAVGLLIATIILSVLLFAALCVIGVWFFLRWRKIRHYNEFTDNSSLASRTASLGEQDKPEEVRPRLNIEELKKSEKRLQERLAVPMEEVTVEPMPRKLEPAVEAILDVPVPQHSVPIVIQSIDKLKDADDDSDNDEFGEVSKARRKSVVTFNENVEKIIHVQNEVDESETDGIVTVDNDDAGSTSTDDIAIYRL